MEKLVKAFWAWRCRNGYHRFQIISDKTQINFIPGLHLYERQCQREGCGKYQKLSVCYGLHFLDAELDERPTE